MSAEWTTKSIALFTGVEQVENFRSMATIFPSRVVRRAARASRLPRGTARELPATYGYLGKSCRTDALLEETETTGLLVLQHGHVVYEEYWLGNTASTQWCLWSVTKSLISALTGIAVAEGAIESLEDPIPKYVPRLAESGFARARVKDVLQMSSGVRWNEAYSNPSSDVRTRGGLLARGESRDDLAASLTASLDEPGTVRRYSSMDTHVLGMVLRGATGTALTQYLQDKLWTPLGMESDAFFIVDGRGAEWAAAGLNATLRDLARFALLYLQRGQWNGQRILPAAWIEDSVTPAAPRADTDIRAASSPQPGYGYQWWLPDTSGAFAAVGVYNQLLFIDPNAQLAIAKTSAPRNYALRQDAASYREPEHLALCRAIRDAMI